MIDFKDTQILKEMFPEIKDYETVIMSVVNFIINGKYIGLGVRLNGWKKNDPNATYRKSFQLKRGLFKVEEVPQVIKYYQLIAQRRDDRIGFILTN